MIFLIIFHALCQCDVANVIANDVRNWGCEWDVVVTMNGEADCSLRDFKTNNSSPLDHSLYCIIHIAPFSLFFYLHVFTFSLDSAAVWVSCGFYWFLHFALLYSQHSKFNLCDVWAKKFGTWVICWPVNCIHFVWKLNEKCWSFFFAFYGKPRETRRRLLDNSSESGTC